MSRPIAPGKDSSEYRKALRAETAGFVLIVLSLAAAGIGAELAQNLLAAVGVSLAAIGAGLVAHSSAAYSKARAAVKASAVAPPPPNRIDLHQRRI